MLRNRRERGEGQVGCLVGLVLLLAAALVAYKMIPVKVKTAEMRDAVVDEAKSAGQHNDKQMMASILDSAKRLELPVNEENVSIRRTSDRISVEVEYVVPVNFPGYVYNWKFRHKAENPIF
jgi:hypothetical protein